jgi:hypothetical protein
MSTGIDILPRPHGLLLRAGAWDVEGWGEVAEASSGEVRALLADLPVEAEDFREMLDSRDPPAAIRCAIVSAWLSARAAASGLPLAGLRWSRSAMRRCCCAAGRTGLPTWRGSPRCGPWRPA